MATINHKTYNEGTETFKDFSVYDGKDTLIFKVDGADQTVFATNIIGSGIIKTSDNSALSGTLKTLTDGLGNDSALALSTGAASITGTLTTSSITRAERLQVGTAASLNTPAGTGNTLQFANYSPSAFVTGSADSYIYKNSSVFGGLAAQSLVFQTRSDVTGGGFAFVAGGTPAVVATITGAGNVGIGTSSPATKLTVRPSDNDGILISSSNDSHTGFFYFGDASSNTIGSISYDHFSDVMRFNTGAAERFRITANGVTFNGDTAAANALDDYEEGTWTMGVSFGGGSTGVTYSINTGSYTKIGRKVTVTGYVVLTSKGTDTGVARITGLPFTIAGATGNFSAPTLYLQNITFANAFQGFGVNGATTIAIYEVTEAGAVSTISNNDFSDTSEIILSFTYFV